jgi:hypothetical protein
MIRRPRRRGPAGALPRALAAAAFVTAGIATPLGGALGSLVGSPAGCAGAAGSIHVAVVVDFGGMGGAPASPRVDCVSVPAGSDGAKVLAARATQLGLPAPRWNVNTGLLCAIDGFPQTGCATTDANGTYTYWSYWGAVGDSWRYATTGPIGHVLADGAVEGWRFGSGRGTSQDDAPRASVSASRCPTTAAPPSPTPTAPPPAATGGGGSGTSTRGPSPAVAASPGAAATATGAGPAAGASTTTVAGQPAAAPVSGATNTSSTTTIAPTAVKGATEQRAGSVTIRPNDGGSTGWIPTVAGVGAVGAAAAGVVFIRRRRLRGES